MRILFITIFCLLVTFSCYSGTADVDNMVISYEFEGTPKKTVDLGDFTYALTHTTTQDLSKELESIPDMNNVDVSVYLRKITIHLDTAVNDIFFDSIKALTITLYDMNDVELLKVAHDNLSIEENLISLDFDFLEIPYKPLKEGPVKVSVDVVVHTTTYSYEGGFLLYMYCSLEVDGNLL